MRTQQAVRDARIIVGNRHGVPVRFTPGLYVKFSPWPSMALILAIATTVGTAVDLDTNTQFNRRAS